ncbi:uncharacterized protein LOC125494685 [Beta vulgaris subsp. vulgaris]|uniref:uncharacterized protein LOC125494685 n=1 Tax=Beta vulgaris subsp. vulgaris TaxID=3555 RepID=UPI002036DD32|nr:uncharacterized protein LOC125494685 [Beta vulgaris subsp. vulgaris]
MPRMSISSTYQRMIGVNNAVHWDKLVWNRLSIPKHIMICWLAMHQRMRTSDLLVKLGVLEENKCMLCADGMESHNHLFFQCSYSSKCLELVKVWLHLSSAQDLLQRQWYFLQKSRRTGLQKKFIAAIFSGLIYSIWWARNEAAWNKFFGGLRLCSNE